MEKNWFEYFLIIYVKLKRASEIDSSPVRLELIHEWIFNGQRTPLAVQLAMLE